MNQLKNRPEGLFLGYSDESLSYLDQASAIDNEADIARYLLYIESLQNREKKAFLWDLEKENPCIYREYKKVEDEKNERAWKKAEEQRLIRKAEDDKTRKDFFVYWTTDRLLNTIKEINPDFCGICYEKNYRYYKYVDFSDAIHTALGSLCGFNDMLIVLPSFVTLMRGIKKGENRCFVMNGPSDNNFTLCYSAESRESYRQNLKIWHEKSKNDFIQYGYSCMEA